MSTIGYSGTPFAKKLGIKAGYFVLLVNEPKHYLLLFEDMPEVNYVVNPSAETVDFIHLFCTNKVDFKNGP